MCPPCLSVWGSSMEATLTYAPLLPWWLIGFLAGLSTLGILIAAWRGLPGWWLRGLAALILLAALAEPVWRQEARDPLKDIVFVVIDETESQTVSNRSQQVDRAHEAIETRLANLENVEVKTLVISTPENAEDPGSLVMTSLARAAGKVAQDRIAGAIILSDGRVHDAKALAAFPAPVHLLLTGEKTDWDRRLVIRNAPAFAIVGEAVQLQLRIEDQGAVPSEVQGHARIRIAVDGGEFTEFRIKTGRNIRIPVILPHAGQNVLQFSVVPTQGELTDRNNDAVVAINGVRDRLRVLLVSGEPYAGERTWRNLLKADSAVDLVHFTILRPPEKQDGVPVQELSLIAFPTRELFLEKVDEFDLIIFDRYRRRGILPSPYLENIAGYVERGGAVLVASGPAFAGAESLYRTALSRILPARPTARILEEGYVPQISELGQRHPVTEGLEDFAPRPRGEEGNPGWGRWFRLVDSVALKGQTVMEGPEGRPLLILDRVGQGRIAMLTSDQAWLWDRKFEGGGPQSELLRRLAHWMMKEPELEEERLSATVNARVITVTRRSMETDNLPLTILGPDDKSVSLEMEQVSPGRWQSRFEAGKNGLYRLADGNLSSVIALGPSAPKEFENTIAGGDSLKPLIQSSRGGILRLEQVSTPKLRMVRSQRVAAGRDWIGLTPRYSFLTKDVRQTPLLPAWLVLLVLVALILTAWRVEGR